VTGLSYIKMQEGWLDLAVIIDLYARRISRKTHATRKDARQYVFDCIEFLHTPKRKHGRNGLLSPNDVGLRYNQFRNDHLTNSVNIQVTLCSLNHMVTKTAVITLVSTLLIFIFALSYKGDSGGGQWGNGTASMTGASGNWAQNGGRSDWGGGASSYTGASGGYSSGGASSNWGNNSSSFTGASGSFGGGGERGGWGGEGDGGFEGGDD